MEFLSPSDISALGYVLTNTKYPVRELRFEGCDGDRTDLKLLEDGFKCCTDLNALGLFQCKGFGAELLALGLKLCTRLERLILRSTIFKEYAKVLASIGISLNLEMLDVTLGSNAQRLGHREASPSPSYPPSKRDC